MRRGEGEWEPPWAIRPHPWGGSPSPLSASRGAPRAAAVRGGGGAARPVRADEAGGHRGEVAEGGDLVREEVEGLLPELERPPDDRLRGGQLGEGLLVGRG